VRVQTPPPALTRIERESSPMPGDEIERYCCESAREWFHQEHDLLDYCIPASLRVLSTAAHLRDALGARAGMDWSSVIVLVFKAFEIELLVRVLQPFRQHLGVCISDVEFETVVTHLKKNNWSRPFGRFLGGGRPPALAESMTVLSALNGIAADTPRSVLAELKGWLRTRYPVAHHLWGPRGVARKIERAAIEFRNPYVHDNVADVADVGRVFDRLWGRPSHTGVLLQALRALTSGLPKPSQTEDACPNCAELLWRYSLRVPEDYCPRCAVIGDIPSVRRHFVDCD
jgi:hypothetical protein